MPSQLDSWAERLSGAGLPAFAKTIREVSHVATDRDSSARDLSDVVSHDAAMTARLIQIANSPLFNAQGHSVGTISNAVVLMGFDAVQELAISLCVIDDLLQDEAHDRVSQIMARAFHAAVQANSLAQATGAKIGETVFVAALLRDIGEMAFWSRGGEAADSLDRALQSEPEPAVAQQRELGFTLAALSRCLAEKWSLGDLVHHSHDPAVHTESSVSCVVGGHALAQAYESHGWSGEESQRVIQKLASELEIDVKTLRASVEQNIEAAIAIAKKFGVEIQAHSADAGRVFEQSHSPVAEAVTLDTTSKARTKPATVANPDSSVTSRIDWLDLIALGIENGEGRDELMHRLVTGLYTCTGAQGCEFMLLAPDRERLHSKYSAGQSVLDTEISLAQRPDLAAVLSSKRPQCMEFQAGPLSCVITISGIQVGARAVGILYVAHQSDDVDEDILTVLRQFSQQVVLILTQAG